MALFCSVCDNLLDKITTSHDFKYKCYSCTLTKIPNNENTLLYEEKKDKSLVVFETILLNAERDPVNPKVYKNCKKCDSKLYKQVRLGENMQLINKCIKCKHTFIEGIE